MNPKNEISRITIDLPKIEHKRLKALAAVLGKSMRELVLESIQEHTQKYPNKTTLKAIKSADKKKGLVKAKNAKDLFRKLGI